MGPVTRRESLRMLGGIALLAAASPAAGAPPPNTPRQIVTPGGTRLYPTGADTQWWTPQTIINGSWTLPQVLPSAENPPGYVGSGFPTMGASLAADGDTLVQDLRNTPRHGVFTRMYQQLVTRPLLGAQRLEGTLSLAVHAVQFHRKINAVLAAQVVVHAPDRTARGVALEVTSGNEAFPVGSPARTRALVALPLLPVECEGGDVIAINVGLWANNESRSLGQGVGLLFHANQASDIAFVDTAALGNSWVEFSAPLAFQP
jgi:hypothetical protein